MAGKNNKGQYPASDHTRFGGIIYPSDFNTNYSDGNFASRIEQDKKFDEQCRKNIECRKNGGNRDAQGGYGAKI